MGEKDISEKLLADYEDVFADIVNVLLFHGEKRVMILCKPITQFLQSFGKRRETSLLVVSSAVRVGNTDTGVDPDFVDIKPTAVETKNFKSQKITS